MKIKKYNNRKTERVLLEFDEFYSSNSDHDAEVIDALSKEFGARRMAYNMWEFESQKRAEEFSFMYRLKHENNS